MRKRLLVVLIFVVISIPACTSKNETTQNNEISKEQDITTPIPAEEMNEEEVTKNLEIISEDVILDKKIEYLDVSMKISNTWEHKQEENGVSVNLDGGLITVNSSPVEGNIEIKDLENTFVEEQGQITEKIFNRHEEKISSHNMYVFDYTGKSNQNDIHGTMYQFVVGSKYYLVSFTFYADYDYKNLEALIMDNFKILVSNSVEDTQLDYPVGNVKKYLTGKGKRGKVYLEGVVDEVIYDKYFEETEFTIWYKRGKTYYKGDLSVSISDEDMELYNIPKLKKGKTYYFLCDVYKDGSFGVYDEYSIIPCKKGDSLKKVHSKYKEACDIVPPKSLMRSPKKNKYRMVKYTGDVLQIVDREYLLEFLMYLDDGSIINVIYDGKGKNKILEDDRITIWGDYLCNHSYETVLGSNKEVARINAVIIE